MLLSALGVGEALALGLDRGDDIGHDHVDRVGHLLAGRTALDLDRALGDPALAHGDLVGPADEVGIVELDARTLVAVVKGDAQPRGVQLLHDPLRNREHRVIAHGERDHDDLGGRDGHGPDDAVLVVVLLDDGRERARDAHAVAAHDEGLLGAVLVHEQRAHGLGVLGPELEDLAQMIKTGALCGLGQSAPNPVVSTLKYFKDEYIAHVRDKKCPAGVCVSMLKYIIMAETCRRCGICAKNCPVGAISGDKEHPYVIDQDKCIKCGVCMSKCPFKSILKNA